jgi:hypothetical protein
MPEPRHLPKMLLSLHHRRSPLSRFSTRKFSPESISLNHHSWPPKPFIHPAPHKGKSLSATFRSLAQREAPSAQSCGNSKGGSGSLYLFLSSTQIKIRFEVSGLLLHTPSLSTIPFNNPSSPMASHLYLAPSSSYSPAEKEIPCIKENIPPPHQIAPQKRPSTRCPMAKRRSRYNRNK